MSKTVLINVKEISYGFIEIEVPDETTEDQLYEKADEAYGNGAISWGKTEFTVTDIIPE